MAEILYHITYQMPKVIEPYSSKRAARRSSPEADPLSRCSLINIAILSILILFLVLAGADSWTVVSTMEKSISEQSKVCLAEFTKKQCNSLDLTADCKKLFSCVQLQDQSAMASIIRYLSAFCK